MQMSLLVVATCVLFGPTVVLAVQSDVPQSMSVAEFAVLDDAARRQTVAAAYRSRLERLNNLRYMCRQKTWTQRINDGLPGEIVWPGLMTVAS